ncbi:MAG: HYR domain-containing protein [Chloroflexi bacterium]|nr:HYR domain-containing protein [Chloroflexota bacterium]
MFAAPVARRAAAFAIALSLGVAGLAFADTLATDGDAVTAGNQAFLDLGEVAPGASVTVDVVLRLTCKYAAHAAAGSIIDVAASTTTVPVGGALIVSPGRISVPTTWPASGESCPTGIEPVTGDVPARLSITAPTTPGADRPFSVLFGLSPADGITGLISFSVVLDVVEAAPADTTAPVLVGVSGPLSAWTSGETAVVSWPLPTATDDTDPSPAVSCTPASGEAFPVGTSTVTCTATDAAGNQAHGGFDVTVQRLAASWGSPLDSDASPALVGTLGRTIPLKLSLSAGDTARSSGVGDAPVLVLEQLTAAGTAAVSGATRSGGSFTWSDGAWHLNLRTGELAPGSWRLAATVDGTPVATAIVLLVPRASSRTETKGAANRAAR